MTLRGDEAAKLAGAIEPDEDLAEQPLVASRLAPSAEDLDGRLRDRPGRLGGRERAGVDPLGRREEARSRDEVGVASSPRVAPQQDVAARPRPRRQGPARRHELDDPPDLLVGLGEPGLDEPVSGADATERRGHERLGTAALEQEHDPGIPGQVRRDGIEGAPQGRRLP